MYVWLFWTGTSEKCAQKEILDHLSKTKFSFNIFIEKSDMIPSIILFFNVATSLVFLFFYLARYMFYRQLKGPGYCWGKTQAQTVYHLQSIYTVLTQLDHFIRIDTGNN